MELGLVAAYAAVSLYKGSQILYIIFFAHPFLPFICPLGCEPLRTGGVPSALVNLTA